MLAKLKGLLAVLVSCSLLLSAPKSARAQSLNTAVTEVFIGLIAVGAALGIGIYYMTRRPPSLTGCAVSAENGLQLRNEGDNQTYTLLGDLADVKVGDRIRVSGKKKKNDPAGNEHFMVEKVSKDLGPCRVLPKTTFLRDALPHAD